MSKITDYQFDLSDGERTSPLWRKLAERFEQMLEKRRKDNDNEHTDIETAALRGEINLLKAILAYGKDRPVIGPETPRQSMSRRAGIM